MYDTTMRELSSVFVMRFGLRTFLIKKSQQKVEIGREMCVEPLAQ